MKSGLARTFLAGPVLLALLQPAFSTLETERTVIDIAPRGDRVRAVAEHSSGHPPFAVALLFAGGDGVLNIDTDGEITALRNNFLIRSREIFHNYGVATVSVDAPRSLLKSGIIGFRDTEEHSTDMKHMVERLDAFYRKLPIFLVGTSRGTNSVANLAVRLRSTSPRPLGAVFTTSILVQPRTGNHVFDFRLDQIEMPSLVVHHSLDECWVTPPSKAWDLLKALTSVSDKDLRFYRGGTGVSGRVCEAKHYHGFWSIEGVVIKGIAIWMQEVISRN